MTHDPDAKIDGGEAQEEESPRDRFTAIGGQLRMAGRGNEVEIQFHLGSGRYEPRTIYGAEQPDGNGGMVVRTATYSPDDELIALSRVVVDDDGEERQGTFRDVTAYEIEHMPDDPRVTENLSQFWE